LGLTTGSPSFNWTATGSRIVPGAICENLTSFGGRLLVAGQTKLSEFLKNGAAGSSGTVTEPFALQAKFPHPLVHAHYASGCSLAEAFYQSVAGPFQLLIVGDPLCQPFATRPVITISGIASNDEISNIVSLKIDDSESPVSIAGLEFYVDGILVFRDRMRETIGFDTTGISDGYHELRLVTVASNAIETTGSVVIPVQVNNDGFSTELTSSRTEYLETDTIKLKAKSNFGDSIELVYNMRSLAKKIGQDVEFEIPATLVGRGPIKLEALSIDETGAGVSSLPLELLVEGSISERKEKTQIKK
jgi:hypothetical protein